MRTSHGAPGDLFAEEMELLRRLRRGGHSYVRAPDNRRAKKGEDGAVAPCFVAAGEFGQKGFCRKEVADADNAREEPNFPAIGRSEFWLSMRKCNPQLAGLFI